MASANALNPSGTADLAASSPQPRGIITSLFSSIPVPEAAQGEANPLRLLPHEAKNTFLTLYTLFEREFLPALDLLDRKLVTRLTAEKQDEFLAQPITYLVRSAQQPNPRQSGPAPTPHYEVRLQSWSCSCPAFIFAAFPASVPPLPVPTLNHPGSASATEGQTWPFGGVTRGEHVPPVCKHLLACYLVEHCPMFEHFVEDRQVSIEELAGWAAGWGD